MYHQILLRHVADPHSMEAMFDADSVGQVGFIGEGPFMIIYIKAKEKGRIVRASFETYGCPSAIGCGSWLTQWAEGKAFEEILRITPDELMLSLGGLPLGKEHCAQMTIDAVRSAIRELQEL